MKIIILILTVSEARFSLVEEAVVLEICCKLFQCCYRQSQIQTMKLQHWHKLISHQLSLGEVNPVSVIFTVQTAFCAINDTNYQISFSTNVLLASGDYIVNPVENKGLFTSVMESITIFFSINQCLIMYADAYTIAATPNSAKRNLLPNRSMETNCIY